MPSGTKRVNTTPATVVLVPLDAEEIDHFAEVDGTVALAPVEWDSEEAGVTCTTTLHRNGRPTLCDCGQVLYKMDPTMDEPYADGETVA